MLMGLTTLILQAQDYRLMLQSGNVPKKIDLENFSTKSSLLNRSRNGNGSYAIIQFHKIPTDSDKQILKNSGIQLFDYLPHYAFWAYIPDNIAGNNLRVLGVKDVYVYQGADKISRLFTGKSKPLWAVKESGKYDVYVQIYPNISQEQALASLKAKAWVKIIREKAMPDIIEVRVPIQRLQELADIPFVFFVEPTAPEPELENREATSNHRINFMNSEYAAGRKYDGTGVVVSMGDDGSADTHIDRQGRTGHNGTSQGGNHGDHVSGIIMGAGNLNPIMKGQAPGAHLEVYSGHADIDAMPTPYNTQNVRITSHSLGETLNAGYTTGARSADQQIRQMPDLMHVFSSGNSGSGYFTITGGRKAGKNVVAVGNLSKTDVISGSSSRGPSADGRLKPEICAVGSNVNSTGENNTYYVSSGTSMACPAISGTFAAMYHAYKSLNANNNPPSALIKAILMNSADDLGNAGPDYIYGYGRVNARRAILTLEGNRYFQNNVSQGTNRTHTITVPANTKQLKVMLYWNDYEGSAGSSAPLVNNIDMTLTTPSSATIQPWVLDPANPSSLAVRGVDNINNSEQITLDDPVAGSYTVNISGTTIPQGPQNYVVVYEFVQDEIVVTFPLGGESFHPGEIERVRWDAWGNSGNFTVEYSTNNGTSWTVISSSVAGSERSINWTIPNTPSGQALLRVTRGAQSSQSVANFSIFPPPTGLNLSSACGGVSLTWNAVAGATGYEIFRLGEKYMESVGTTTNTSYLDAVAPGSTYWYAVRALGANNAKSRRTLALSHNHTSVVCSIDAAINSISPQGNGLCNLTSNQTVQVVVRNVGTTALSNLTVNYSVKKSDNTVVFTGSSNIASLAAGTNQTVSFTANLGITNETYTIEASVTVAGDGNSSNNALTVTAQNSGIDVAITQDGYTLIATAGHRNYRWFFNNQLLVSTGTNNTISITQTGTYKVEAQSATTSCKAMSGDLVVTVLGLEDISNELGIYPNPVEGTLQIKLPKQLAGKQKIILTDLSGKIVTQKIVQDKFQEELDMSQLAKGMYILEIQNETHKAIKKVVKQ